jgi:phenylpropionate dioxygenase-like ring-hydroxylating dioxygenase large terminal subunit
MVSQTIFGHPAAPADASELGDALLPFGKNRMLPPAAYTDEAVLQWERRYFFSDWMCVGLRHAAGFRGLDKSQWGLTELPVTEWHGLIFVGTAPSGLAALDSIVAPYEPERLVTAGRHSYDAAANWKILTENYHECYHCPSIHPELCRVSPPKSGENYAADAPPGAAGGEPDPDRMQLGVRAGGRRVAGLRSGLRGGVLGHHEPAGLGRVRRGRCRPRRTRCTRS